MQRIPSLPIAAPLRVLIIAASLSLAALLASTIVLLVRRDKPAAVWAAATLGASLISFWLGRVHSPLHPIAWVVILVLAIRNVVRFAGAARALQALGLVCWAVAVIAARALFER